MLSSRQQVWDFLSLFLLSRILSYVNGTNSVKCWKLLRFISQQIWLIIHNRVWTADRLQRRGWPNCNLCPLCKQVQETAAHLLFQCRFTVRVWTEIKTWLGLHDIDPSDWRLVPSVEVCWDMVAHKRGHSRMVRSTLMMLVAWEIWTNATRGFSATPPPLLPLSLPRLKMRPLFGLVRVRSICVILCRESDLYSPAWRNYV